MINCGITGHTGILGTKLIESLNFNFIKFNGDITCNNDVDEWISKNQFDLIIHLAALVPIKKVNLKYKKAKKINYNGTKNLIDAINRHNIDLSWFFFSSTSHVYKDSEKFRLINEKDEKNPYSAYGKTKLYAENYINNTLNKKYKKCIGRIFSFTDKKQKLDYFIPSVVNKIKRSRAKEVYFENINQYRDFISVSDICLAIKKLWETKANNDFNIGSGIPNNLKDIIIYISKKYKKKAIFTTEKVKTSFIIADIKKIKKLGWRPEKKVYGIIEDYLN
jgi:UDP-glucose 4-epimerase